MAHFYVNRCHRPTITEDRHQTKAKEDEAQNQATMDHIGDVSFLLDKPYFVRLF